MTVSRPITLNDGDDRDYACGQVRIAPKGYVVRISPKKRSSEQNDRFHAICNDCEKSGYVYQGRRREAWEWKWLFTIGWATENKKQYEMVLGLENERVMMRPATSEMTVQELSEVIEYAQKECAERGIPLQEQP